MAFYMKNVRQIKLGSNIIFNLARYCSSQKVTQLIYQDFGDPIKVIQEQTIDLKKPANSNVLVKMLAAPVNPADINLIQGKYPVKVKLPAVPGNEGVAEIIEVGPSVKNLKVGDRVIPLLSNTGTWQTHAVLPSDILYKIPTEVDVVAAATLTVNPCTAYRMLEDFVELASGDTIIQNGANSAVGQNVIQICKSRNVKTINIVRDRPNINELRNFLIHLGATQVLTEEEVRTFKFKSDMKKPKLAFNCVGGKNALEMLRHMDYNSTMVTYGGMSREPVTIPTSALIFKNINFVGFWMTRWSIIHSHSEARWHMLAELIDMIKNGKLSAPLHKLVPFREYKEALHNTISISGFAGKKYILDFSN